MDSDDEFETGPLPGLNVGRQLAGAGLDLNQLLKTRTAEFESDGVFPSLLDDEEFRRDVSLAFMMPTNQDGVPSTNADLYEEFRKQNLGELLANDEEDETSFEAIAKNMVDITPDGGVKKKIVQHGWGETIKPGQTVYIDFLISCEEECEDENGDGTILKQVTIDRSKNPLRESQLFRFKVGAGNVLHVLDIGVQTMKPREVSRFMATPKYAYGPLGLPDRVNPNTTILVEIAIKNVVDGTHELKVWELDREEVEKLSVDVRLKAIGELKQYGMDYYKEGNYMGARVKYAKAMTILETIITPIQDEAYKVREMECILYTNIAACKMQHQEYRRAQRFLESAIKIEDIPITKKLKAYYRMAVCLSEVGEITEARRNIEIAKSIDSANSEIDQLYIQLHQKRMKDFVEEKALARRMMGLNVSNGDDDPDLPDEDQAQPKQ